MAKSLVLFGRDLRLGDHLALAEAAREREVVPALILDPKALARYRRNPRRAAYWCGAVASLAEDLAARGSRLVCRRGALNATALRLARETRAELVVWSAGYDARGRERDRSLQSVLEEAGISVSVVHDAPAVAPEDTAAARKDDEGLGYRSFAAYAAVWRELRRPAVSTAAVRFDSGSVPSEPLPAPEEFGIASDIRSAPSEGGVLAEFERFLRAGIFAYRSGRDVPAVRGTSLLSAPLSFGLISARTILARTGELARDPFLLTEERASLADFERALARRDFFLQLAWYFEETPDLALQSRMRAFPFAREHPNLENWIAGTTGYPLVDAGMRELATTGWMHPRVRLSAASFACFDLGVDWRVARDAWDARLIEDDPAIAAGNWQWIAGVGADLAQFPRIYNPAKQLRAYDPTGAYVRRFVPELAGLSDADLFASPAARPSAQMPLELFGERTYPARILDHETVARAFLERYVAFTR